MTTKKLDAVDFAKMGVHRPMVEREINDIHPAAVVDKTYPHEQPLPENVVILPVVTGHDIPPEEILRAAHDHKLTEFIICGIDDEGYEYLMRTNADPAESVWYLTRAIHLLNNEQDNKRLASLRKEDNE